VLAAGYVFALDLRDEGLETVLDNLQRRGGLSGVTMAAAYHHSRDVFPHNPHRKVVFLEGGSVYFHPTASRYAATRLQPHVAEMARETDWLARLVAAARAAGMRANAWTVFLHNSRLGFLHADCAPRSAFGDPMLTYLCPAHPDVRAFACALAVDVASHGVDAIELEALSYMPFDHGYHHERSFIRLTPDVRFLLGLCFCSACLGRAHQAGVDGERVQHHVRALVEPVFQSARHETEETDVQAERWRAELGGEFGRFLDMRAETVTSLVAEVTEAVHRVASGTRVHFLDPSGATIGYATGRPTGGLATSIGWRDGIDLAAIARACDGLGVLAYFAEPDRFRREVESYATLLPPGRDLLVLLRPMQPDVASPDELAAKLRILGELGVERIGFYHYGFARLESLDWIRDALARA
jgi:hypothetical protein